MLRVRRRIGPAGSLQALRAEPCNHVGDLLVRHGFAWNISSPVRCAQFRSAGNHNRPQALITDQRKKRIVGDGASFRSALALFPVTRRTVGFVGYFASLTIARQLRAIAGRIRAVENSLSPPA